MRLLYPSDIFDGTKPDETYQEEYDACIAAGLSCVLLSSEAFESGDFRTRPVLREGDIVLYRGWMLTLDVYARLCEGISARGATPLTSVNEYERCHHLPGWYELCAEHTPKTIILKKDSDFVQSLSGLGWPAFFVKDYVKSLTTSRGSVAQTPQEVGEIVTLIESYRGSIEGGVCVRCFEDLLPETEERYFVLHGQAYSRTDSIPDLVKVVAAAISSPFFSVDVVSSKAGALRLIELGDGQVSDRKLWPANRFAQMLTVGG